MATFISRNPEETVALGEEWGRLAPQRWLIGLSGDLGAGKTQLVRGLAQGVGCTAKVHSPTFTLLNEYGGGRLPFFHLDLYRLGSPQEIIAAGLEDYFAPAGIAVVEWIENWTARQPIETWLSPGIQFRRASIEILGNSERRIIHEDLGA